MMALEIIHSMRFKNAMAYLYQDTRNKNFMRRWLMFQVRQ